MAKARARALDFVRGTLVPMGVLYVSVGYPHEVMMDKLARRDPVAVLARLNKKPRRGTR